MGWRQSPSVPVLAVSESSWYFFSTRFKDFLLRHRDFMSLLTVPRCYWPENGTFSHQCRAVSRSLGPPELKVFREPQVEHGVIRKKTGGSKK